MKATTTAAAAQRKAMTAAETAFQNAVTYDLCRPLGLWWYHTHDSQHSQKGWPDLAIGRLPRGPVVFWELKLDGEDPTREQVAVLAMLTGCGLVAVVRRPADLRSGLIARELQALARKPRQEPRRAPLLDTESCGCLTANVELYGHREACRAVNR